jgi:hypothetical protein
MTTEKGKLSQKNWYEKHPEYAKNYYQAHKKEMNAKNKDWKKKNPEKNKIIQRNHSKKYRQKLIIQVLSHYGGNPPKCACCGERELDFLTIDHINGGGNQHRKKVLGHLIGGWIFYIWLRKNNFPEGFRVLCWNCQWGCRKHNGVCSHVVHSKC